jgi:hypothetical protein
MRNLAVKIAQRIAPPTPAAVESELEVDVDLGTSPLRAEATPALAEGALATRGAELARAICEAVTSEVEPARILEAALKPVASALRAAPVSIYLRDPETGDLLREAECDDGRRSDRPHIAASRGLVGSALATGQLVASADPTSHPRYDLRVDTPADGRPGPLVCGALRFRGKPIGVFRAFPEHGADAAPELAELIGSALSAAVRNVLLYRSLVETIEEVAEARRAAAKS